MKDIYASRRGSKNVRTNLTEADVRAIRRARGTSGGRMWKRKQKPGAVPVAVLAKKYGVSASAISNIARRFRWKHVP